MLFRPIRFFEADGRPQGAARTSGSAGAGNGSSKADQVVSDPNAVDGTGNDPGKSAGENKNASNNGRPEGAVVFNSQADYQKDLEEKLKDRLERVRKKSEEATKKAAADAEAEAAKKNGEWQKLAEQREKEVQEAQARLAELDPVQQKAERYEVALNFGAVVYLSDTAGTLADAAGTVSTPIGKVIPAWGSCPHACPRKGDKMGGGTA